MRKPRVQWSAHEILKVHEFVLANDKWPVARAIIQGQSLLLPPDRQMARTSVYEALKQGTYYKRVARAQAIMACLPPELRPEPEKFEIVYVGDEPEEDPPISLDEKSMDALATKVAAMVLPSLVDAMRDLAISNRLSKMMPTDEDIRDIISKEPTLPEKVSARRRIDILGLLPSQAEVVKTYLGPRDDVKLRFILSEHATRVDRYAPDVIMCTGFISHSHQDKVRTSGSRLHYANGAAASVTNVLSRLIP